MQLWQTVPTTRLEQMQEEVLSWLQDQLRRDLNQHQFYYPDPATWRDSLPTVKAELAELGLLAHLQSIAVHVLPQIAHQIIHIDTLTAHKWSYNIPIANCADSTINFYDPIEPHLVPDMQVNVPGLHRNVSWFEFHPSTVRFRSQFTMTEPTLLCTAWPHNVTLNANSKTRIALLCRIARSSDLSQWRLDNHIQTELT